MRCGVVGRLADPPVDDDWNSAQNPTSTSATHHQVTYAFGVVGLMFVCVARLVFPRTSPDSGNLIGRVMRKGPFLDTDAMVLLGGAVSTRVTKRVTVVELFVAAADPLVLFERCFLFGVIDGAMYSTLSFCRRFFSMSSVFFCLRKYAVWR